MRYDAVIVGGGLVGAATALALAQAGMQIAVIDRDAPVTQVAPEFDGRGSAVALGSKRFLDRLGVWAVMEPHAGAILDIRISDGPSRLFLHFDHSAVGDEPMGWIVENRYTRLAFHAALAAERRIDWRAPARVSDLARDADGVTVTLADGSVLRGDLLIGTDGRASQVRDHARIPVRKIDYRQTAIVCGIEHERPHDGVAHERFLPPGPLALLPLADPHRSSVVWTETPDMAAALLALDDAALSEEMTARFGPWLGALRINTRRWSYPLSAQIAPRFHDHRLVLVGDSAHGIHPIAGQGVNLGWRDVETLVEELVAARRLGLSAGHADALARYTARRRPDVLSMLAATDALNRLFATDFAPVRLARDLGLAAVQRLPGLKHAFMRQAMGVRR